jgi:hypothetical protein
MDRLDFLRELVRQWREFRRSNDPNQAIVAAVPLCWVESSTIAERLVMQIAEQLIADPIAGLSSLDRLIPTPLVLLQLGGGLEHLSSDDGEQADADDESDRVATLVNNFVAEQWSFHYGDWRTPVIQFCISHCLSPEEMASHLQRTSTYSPVVRDALVSAMQADLSLQNVCRAHSVFWS